MTQSYRDTGHSCNSRSRVVHVSTRSCLSGTSASWVFRSTGERANSCQCRGSLFSAWSWIRSTRQHASPSTCSVCAELPQDFIRQDGGPTETLSEAPGAYGCSCGEVPPGLLHMRPLQHWLHGRVPRWAWKRGTHRVQITPACRKTFSPWTDPLFLLAGVPLEQVSRHVVVFTDASATGWGATYNGHAVSGVWTGPQLRWHIKLPRVAGSTPCLEPPQRAPSGQGRSGPYGQHGDRCVYQLARRFKLPSHVATRPPPPPLESEASEVPSCHPHPRSVQPGG